MVIENFSFYINKMKTKKTGPGELLLRKTSDIQYSSESEQERK